MALLARHCSLSPWPHHPPKNSEAVYPLIINNYQIKLQICFFSLRRNRDTFLSVSVCTFMCGCLAVCVFATLSHTKYTYILLVSQRNCNYWPDYFQCQFFFQSGRCEVMRWGVRLWFTLVRKHRLSCAPSQCGLSLSFALSTHNHNTVNHAPKLQHVSSFWYL